MIYYQLSKVAYFSDPCISYMFLSAIVFCLFFFLFYIAAALSMVQFQNQLC